MGKRKTISAETKAEVALEAIRGLTTIKEIAIKYQIYPNMVTRWKKKATENLASLFAVGQSKNKTDDSEKTIEHLNREVAKLQSDLSWLKEHRIDD